MKKFDSNSKEILMALCSTHSEKLTFTECKEYLEGLDEELCTDFSFDFEGMEFRIIHNSEIWKIYVKTIEDLVNDCYELNLDEIPAFIAVSVDWEQTAKNAYIDGYGHTFSGYDGSEISTGNYWIFRTN